MTAGKWLTTSVRRSWCQLAIGITACATSPWLTRTDLVFASQVCCRARTVRLKRTEISADGAPRFLQGRRFCQVSYCRYPVHVNFATRSMHSDEIAVT